MSYPRLASKLEDSWEGPHTVKEKIGAVNYRVQRDDKKGKKYRVVLVNSVKNYVQREEFIGSVMVVAEETDFETSRRILVETECTEIDRGKLMTCSIASQMY